jgi:peptidoglycan/xylan/chitin deacetylase (PgdA/CDA1 family)
MDPLPPGFRWPDGYRAAAMFTFDVDAEAVMLTDHPEVIDYLDVIGHQRYGPQVAVPRLLRMLDRRGLRTTFFVPGWVAETWPAVIRSIRDAGHEIGTCTRASEARSSRPRRASCSAGSRRSIRCWVSGRSATGRRRAT